MKRSIDQVSASPFSTSTSSPGLMPSAPFSFIPTISSESALTNFSSQWNTKVDADDAKKEVNKDLSKRLSNSLQTVRFNMERGLLASDRPVFDAELSNLLSLADEAKSKATPSPSNNLKIDRQGSGFDRKLEEVVRIRAFLQFLEKGNLLQLSDCPGYSDEEYMGGCMQFCHDLARYSQGRAIERDANSVRIARDLTDEILYNLLKFDFKNGPLRRKYDGVKYAVKRLENILYELSVTDRTDDDDDDHDNGTAAAATRSSRLNTPELEGIQSRMETYDEMREKIIKRSREIQKSAKVAIFSLHRGDFEKADKLMKECETVAKELLPVIEEEPSLRYGSYSNGMEEYAEAKVSGRSERTLMKTRVRATTKLTLFSIFWLARLPPAPIKNAPRFARRSYSRFGSGKTPGSATWESWSCATWRNILEDCAI